MIIMPRELQDISCRSTTITEFPFGINALNTIYKSCSRRPDELLTVDKIYSVVSSILARIGISFESLFEEHLDLFLSWISLRGFDYREVSIVGTYSEDNYDEYVIFIYKRIGVFRYDTSLGTVSAISFIGNYDQIERVLLNGNYLCLDCGIPEKIIKIEK
jgi:hypothetical protein